MLTQNHAHRNGEPSPELQQNSLEDESSTLAHRHKEQSKTLIVNLHGTHGDSVALDEPKIESQTSIDVMAKETTAPKNTSPDNASFQANELPLDRENQLESSYLERPATHSKVLSELDLSQNHDIVDMIGDTSTFIGEHKEQLSNTQNSLFLPPVSEISEPEERASGAFYVKNHDTGEILDLRKEEEFKKVHSGSKPLRGNQPLVITPWKEYWYDIY